jgi:excinuclease ABC subunit C
MFSGAPRTIETAQTPGLDAALEEVVPGPGVFALHAVEGEPLLGKSALLRRRLKRLLAARERPSRLLNLRHVVQRIEYWPTASRLESSLVLYEAAREYLPRRYIEFLKLRMPAYIRLMLGNPFPRTQITTKLGAPPDVYYGPFRSRLGAEEFEHAFLDLFQLRRCQEELEPSPEHPGCVYGEMAMCLRPCQLVVGMEEYRSEAERVQDFLLTNGRHLMESAEHARDRLSAEMQFEEAARQHKRAQKIAEVLKLRDEMVREASRVNGVAVLPSAEPESITLLFLLGGAWCSPVVFAVPQNAAPTVSLDHRLRDLAAGLAAPQVPARERQEHLAIWTRWYYSSWRDGSWLPFDDLQRLPWRRLVNAISRTAAAT